MPIVDAIAPLQPRDLPSPPAVMLQVIHMAADPNVGMERLAQVAGTDQAFAAELIRIANSPFYGAQAQVGTTSRAMMMMGLRYVRNLAITFSAREVMRSSGFGADVLADFWEEGLRRGAAAKRLATLTKKADPDEAFTLGLLLDFGLLALFRAHPHQVTQWSSLRPLSPTARRARELELFGTTHDEAGKSLATRWGLPPVLAGAIGMHHQDTPANASQMAGLAAVGRGADELAALLASPDPRASLLIVQDILRRTLNIDAETCESVVEGISKDTEDAAAALGLPVRKQAEWSQLQASADQAIAELNGVYDNAMSRLETVLHDTQQRAAKLEANNVHLSELAYHDPLTGLANRRRYMQCLREEMKGLVGQPGALSLVLLDLDHFKLVNDTYGHVFGDTVLQAVALVMREGCRGGDLKARVGGEEMALVLPCTTEAEGRRLTERIREMVAAREIRRGAQPVRITASFGGCTIQGPLASSAANVDELIETLIEEADRQLYIAKQGGRNRVAWSRLVAGS